VAKIVMWPLVEHQRERKERRVARTGSGSRIPAKVAAPATASKPMASQILASPP
jgi:hypothetical protein